jgi:hypothetical protein
VPEAVEANRWAEPDRRKNFLAGGAILTLFGARACIKSVERHAGDDTGFYIVHVELKSERYVPGSTSNFATGIMFEPGDEDGEVLGFITAYVRAVRELIEPKFGRTLASDRREDHT